MSPARLAQSVERKALNLVVVGSSPTVGVSWVTDSQPCHAQGTCGPQEAHHEHASTYSNEFTQMPLWLLLLRRCHQGHWTAATCSKHEGREIRTPNLLIWSQTRCRCAIPPMPQPEADKVMFPGMVPCTAEQGHSISEPQHHPSMCIDASPLMPLLPHPHPPQLNPLLHQKARWPNG